MEDYQKYIENVITIRNLSKVVLDEKDDKQAIINKIQSNAKKCYEYKVWNDNFLNDFLFNKEVKDISKEDADNLIKFVNGIFNYTESLDLGISFKVFEKLLEYAKYNNDIKMYIEELYYTGVSLFYLSTKGVDDGDSVFANKIISYFIEGAKYVKDFEKYDSKTRQFIIRCLGNQKISINRLTKEGVYEYYKKYDEAMAVIDSKKYQEIDSSLNWANFIYSMNMDQLAILSYLRNYDDEYVANRVLDAATYVYNKNLNEDDSRLQNWRIDYFYKAALYHAGKLEVKELVDDLLKVVYNTDFNDISITGLKKNLSAKYYLLFYANKLESKDKEILNPIIQKQIKNTYKYLDQLPGEYYRHTMSEAVRNLVEMQADVSENDKSDMMNYIVAFHKPTYVHSLMVASLTKALTACMLMRNPEYLIGVLDTTNKEDVLSKSEAILNLAYNCGFYHDVGKNMVMSYININERKLINEEFECIKTHAKSGYDLLIKNKNNENYALAALYHHVFYDGSKGYPDNLEPCPSFIKPIVDILSVADSIDAATDSIGRHYTKPKTLDSLIEEFKTFSGTRYSPSVISLFDDKSVLQYIDNIITNERIIIYLNVYHKGRTYTVSTYLKDNKSDS